MRKRPSHGLRFGIAFLQLPCSLKRDSLASQTTLKSGSTFLRHYRGNGNPGLFWLYWIPALADSAGMTERWILRGGHEPVGFEKLDDEFVEAGWVFNAAGMAGSGKNFVHCARNERSRSLSRRQRVVVLAVDDQRRNFHRTEPGRHVRSAARAKNLADGFAGEPGISFDERVEQILA